MPAGYSSSDIHLMPLDPPDARHLAAAEGWLGLGN